MGKYSTLLIVFLLPIVVLGQDSEVRFNHLTIEDGLSQSTVESITQDYIGYMWFGTNDGLNRYDGLNFSIYKHSPDDPNSISDNDIQVIYEDKQQRLWVGTHSRGLNHYDRKRDAFVRYHSISEDLQTLSANTVWSLFEDSNGNFWVGTAHGLNIMDREKGTFDRMYSDPDDSTTLSNNRINLIHEDSEGILWFGTENGINRYNSEEKTFQRYLHTSSKESSSSIILTIYETQNGVLWVGTNENFLYFYNRERDVFQRLDPEHFISGNLNAIEDILEDQEGNLWVGSGISGLDFYDFKLGKKRSFMAETIDPSSLNSNFIISLYQSRDKTIWIGTFNGGVNFIEAKPKKFRHFKNEPSNPNSVSNNTVRALLQDRQGFIWIGTDGGGLDKFNPEDYTFEHFKFDPEDRTSLSSNVILDIVETDHGLWLATYGGGVDLFDPKNGKVIANFRNNPSDQNRLSSDYVFAIRKISDGKLWFGTNRGGISVLDPDKGTFTYHIGDTENQNDPATIGNNDVREIFEDINGDIWIGAYGEILNRFDTSDGLFHKYEINTDDQFFASIAQLIFEDSKNRLWMGTRGGGLLLLDRQTDKLKTFTTKDGLPSNTIHAIEEDSIGNLWLSTNNGISRFHPEQFEFKNFQIQDGLQSREYSPRASITDKDGNIYFGGLNGFNRFVPEQVVEDTVVQPVLITDLLLFNRIVPIKDDSMLDRPLYLKEELVLDHKQTVITFEYTTLDFSAEKANNFAYMLEGFENEWNYVGNQRRATYTNLNPGQYTFRVKASNNDGVWDEEGISLALIITPPFWKTTWFITLLCLAVAGLIVLVFHLRFRSINKTNKLLEQLVSERTEELETANATKDKLFSIIGHDLNNVAAGLVGITDLLKHSIENKNLKDSKEYVGYLSQSSAQFVALLKNLLQWARSQTGKIQFNPRQVKLDKIVIEILNQEEMSAFNKGITLSAHIDPKLHVFGDQDMISVILRNLVNNALKFTEHGGNIEVSAYEDNQIVVVSVKDDGIGMDKETIKRIFSTGEKVTTIGTSNEKGTGLGLSLCIDFVRRNGGTLKVDSKKNEGTTISFTLPVINDKERVQKTEG